MAAEIAITPAPLYGSKAAPEDINWAYKTALTTPGAGAYIFTATWGDLADPKAEKFNELKTAAFFGLQLQHPGYLGLYLIDASRRELPEDHRKSRWGKSSLLLATDNFLKNTSETTGQNIRWLSLGDKADVYLAEHPDEADEFLSFYKKAAVSARRTFPNAKIGLTVTYEGLTGTRKDIAVKLIEASDAVFISYVPFSDKVKSGEVISKELTDLLAMPFGKSIVFQDISIPSARTAESSEELQATTLSAILQQLKASPAVEFANLRQLHDMPSADCRALQKYYKQTPEFARDSLCSLGFFTANGKPKKSWQAIQDTLRPAEPTASKAD